MRKTAEITIEIDLDGMLNRCECGNPAMFKKNIKTREFKAECSACDRESAWCSNRVTVVREWNKMTGKAKQVKGSKK